MKITTSGAARALATPLTLLTASLVGVSALAQQGPNFPITAQQRAIAQQVAAQGVPLSELAPDAPDSYTVRRGDTLWRISGLFLKSPWRWPELWGMNQADIRNPHLIYPGQQLYLERAGGRAMLRARRSMGDDAPPTVRVSPRNRTEVLDANPLPTLQPHLIEPFLAEPLVVDDGTFQRAPRIVAMSNMDRVIMAKGDRAYARGPADAPLLKGPDLPNDFRVFRTAKPLKDPVSGEILGYEGQYVGRARLVRGESEATPDQVEISYDHPRVPAGGEKSAEAPRPEDTRIKMLPVPATLDIVSSKEEMRAGDRLLPEPPRDYRSYMPHAPGQPVDARVVAVYGNSVRYAGQNQVVVINKGLDDGIESGQVLALLSTGQQIIDKTDQSRERIRLPDERNGIAMVFMPFERVAYVLVMEITNPVQVGDKLVNPR
ncbi:MAG: LysM peptidoglycan-binding domain-containing protein [Proteobacteria bacterium]|jgi:hypothetical protein|nr:LysM peptidoglycan-binding domain-containing protein [Pseudomonadota bacterium]